MLRNPGSTDATDGIPLRELHQVADDDALRVSSAESPPAASHKSGL
jgi:hypothetical protein